MGHDRDAIGHQAPDQRRPDGAPFQFDGIGAGAGCDGQILVLHDMLGLTPADRTAKFVKRFAELGAAITHAAQDYLRDVETGVYPAAAHTYE